MTTLNIVPTKSVNDVKFGSNRASCEIVFGTPKTIFKKSKWAKGSSADYGDFHLYYDADESLEAVELFSGSVHLPNDELLIPADKAVVLKAIPTLVSDEYGLTSNSQSVGASVEDGKVTSILFGRASYYA